MPRGVRCRAEDLAPRARAAIVAVPVHGGKTLRNIGLAIQKERRANEGLVHRQDPAHRRAPEDGKLYGSIYIYGCNGGGIIDCRDWTDNGYNINQWFYPIDPQCIPNLKSCGSFAKSSSML